VKLQVDGLRRVRITAAERGLALVSCCWTAMAPREPDTEPSLLAVPAALMSASATTGRCLVYDFAFPREHDDILITLNVPIVLAIAFRGDRAVATASGATSAEFTDRSADRVLVYARARERYRGLR
jgi:hypothetical protein